MTWLIVNGNDIKLFPSWKRAIYLAKDGKVYVAAALGGSEKKVSTCTLADRTPFLIYANHVYVPMLWIIKNFPAAMQYCKLIGDLALVELKKRRGKASRINFFENK